MAGGMGLVTVLRLVQVGRARMEAERRRPPGEPRPDEDAASVAAEPAPTLVLPSQVASAAG